jgi:hypothetical protein
MPGVRQQARDVVAPPGDLLGFAGGAAEDAKPSVLRGFEECRTADRCGRAGAERCRREPRGNLEREPGVLSELDPGHRILLDPWFALRQSATNREEPPAA